MPMRSSASGWHGLARLHRAVGLEHHGCGREAWGFPLYTIGVGERQAGDFAGNGVRLSKVLAAAPRVGLCSRRSTISHRLIRTGSRSSGWHRHKPRSREDTSLAAQTEA